MLSNAKMKSGRFERWATCRRICREIIDRISGGEILVIATAYKATQYDHRHADCFKSDSTGVYVRRGKSWDCIHTGLSCGLSIRFYRKESKQTA